MAVTRIKNNQITDSTITYAKIAPGTLVGSNFNQNLTLNSNVSIVGNLTITGTSSSINSTNTYVNDPLIVFNNGYTGSLVGYDIGMIVNRNLSALNGYGSVNTAWVWVEADAAFEAIATTDAGTGVTSINNSGFANIKVGNVTAISGTYSGTIAAAILNGSHTGTAAFTTATATNFSTGNAQVTGGNVQGVTYLNAVNFSTGNAQITGGALNGTSVGATTPAAGFFTNTTTGTLSVTGDSSLAGNLSVTGNITLAAGNITSANSAFFVGNTITGFNALYAGIPTGYTILPQVVAQFSENYNGYAQLNTQNINAGGDATSDYVATANNGDDTTFYVDLGIAGSGYDPNSPENSLGSAMYPNDAYLYTQANTSAEAGGNLVIGSTTSDRSVKFVIGGGNVEHISTTINHPGTSSTSTTTGALVVNGGVGVNGNLTAVSVYGNVIAQYASPANFSTGNALITGGSLTGITGAATTFTATNFSTGNAQITGGNAQGLAYLQSTNFSTGNALITGGSIQNISVMQATNFSTPNAAITGGTITGVSGSASTLLVSNFGTANAQITGGNVQGIVYSQATNFSTGNARITGGSITGITGAATTFTATNFSTGNAQITGGSLTGFTGAATTLQATNFSTGNAQITGGSLTGFTGAATTLTATNFSSGNIVGMLTGTASTANVAVYVQVTSTPPTNAAHPLSFTDTPFNGNASLFTTPALTMNPITNVLTAPNVRVTSGDASTTSASGALVVTGGVGVGGNLYVGQNIVVTGNLTVQGTTTAINSATLDVTDLNITVAKGAVNGAAANGAGLTVDGANATLLYTNSTDSWNFNKQVIGQFTTSNLQATGGSITNFTGAASTLVATNFSTGNAQVSGGNAQGLTYLQATNLSTGNALITGGSITGITGAATTLVATNFSSGNAQITGGNVQGVNYLLATNFSTANARITGGSITGITGAATTLQATNFSTGNAQITGGSITGATGQFNTLTATNFSSGNIVGVLSGTASTANVSLYDSVTATSVNATFYPQFTDRNTTGNSAAYVTSGITINPGTATVTATNFNGTFNGTANITAGNIVGVSGSAVDFVVTHLATANANITGGNITAVKLLTSNVVVANDFISPNVDITGGRVINVHGSATDFDAQNFTSGNVYILGGNISGIQYISTQSLSTPNANIYGGSITSVSGNADTFGIVNLTSGNAVLTGGSIDGMAIGVTTPTQAHFTEVFAQTAITTGNIVVASTVDLVDPTNAAFIVQGGASVAKSVYVGGTINIGANSLIVPLVNSSISATNSGVDFCQIGLTNTTSTGSADFSAYASNGDNNGGWSDFGFTGPDFADPLYTITKPNDGYLIARPAFGYGGNLVIATSEAGTHNDVIIGVGSFDESAEVARFVGNATTGGYLRLTHGTAASSTSTGALRVTGGVGITGNAYVGGNVVATGTISTASSASVAGNITVNGAAIFNAAQTSNYDTIVKGKADTTLVWAHAGSSYDQVVIGGNAAIGNLIPGAKFHVNSTDTMMLPRGTSAQRPSSVGATDVPGMLRYNTTLNALEYFGGTLGQWSAVSTQFTIIADEQFSGTGSQTVFALSSNQTTNNCIVTVNGVVQIPVLGYSISGSTLTFTSPPANGSVVDVRKLTTTEVIVEIASQNDRVVIGAENSGIQFISGTSGRTLQYTLDTSGAWVTHRANTAVVAADTPTAVDSFATGTYRSAKYLIQATSGSDYQVMEALVIHDGTTPVITTYGVVKTGANLGVLTSSISAGTLNVNFISANANTNVRVSKDYMLI